MIVPPFMPEPIEISGSVAEGTYRDLVRFIRQAIVLHFLSSLLVIGLTYERIPRLPYPQNLILFLASLIGLSVLRRAVKGRHWEMYGSAMVWPITLVSLAGLLPSPTWVFAFGPLCACAFVLCCGQDLSLIGMGVFGFLGGLLLLSLSDALTVLPDGLYWKAALGLLLYMVYLVYDTAMITRRRRRDEALGAAIDLYRDLLNFTTYPLRVYAHWQKHRIWSLRLALADGRGLNIMSLRRLQDEVRRNRRKS